MIILAENSVMEPAFNKILKEDIEMIIPFIQKLSKAEFSDEILLKRFTEMFDQNYECFGIFLNEKLIGVFGL